MKKTLAKRGRLPALAAAVALAATLGACHHNDDDAHKATEPPVADNPNPPSVADAFVTYVTQLVANLSDTDEPLATDGVAATSPENTEPQPLPAS